MFTFPTEKNLEGWVSVLKKYKDDDDEPVSSFLPKTDDNWKSRMTDVFTRVKYKYSVLENKDLCFIASEIFYKINKIHSEIDSNKRSAIICTYFFFTLNLPENKYGSKLFQKNGAKQIYKMAKLIAKSKGNRCEKMHIKRRAEEFRGLI